MEYNVGMAEHKDEEQVTFGYASSKNITFHGKGLELGVTWGEWREMSEKAQAETINEAVWELVDIWVEE